MNLGDTAIDLYDRFMIYGWFKVPPIQCIL
jgi:hypothetical protein